MPDLIPQLVKDDPWLSAFSDVIIRRQMRVYEKEAELTRGKVSLSDFATGYLYYGLHKTAEGWVFREWAPNATEIYLTGSFSKWKDLTEYKLHPLENGVWEIVLPEEKLKHEDLFKLSIHWKGGHGLRIPSYIKRVIQDDKTKLFNAQVWHTGIEYKWTHPSPQTAGRTPLIYEAHVGMATEESRIGSFNEFRVNVLPRIKKGGYNTIQLMAIQEHPYYGSFGYHVSNFFAVSSRFGTPEELKMLVDEAHGMGMAVIMDIVHSHAVKNELEGLGMFDGSPFQYFHTGPRREHVAWDSLCFNYARNEVLHFLLSNCKFWLEEYRFDGFRFDGVTSMLYYDHGLSRDFTNYSMYYDGGQDEDAIVYLTLSNKLIKSVKPEAITVAEEMSGMPGIGVPLKKGGVGFDYRMAMGIPDYWIKIIKELPDENWDVPAIFHELTQKRQDERTVSYAESHDQALVGDKTIIFRLIDQDMYFKMDKKSQSLIVDRGIALHKIIRLATASTAGGGYLNFMGNEFGHPEWIDFPREGNNWSYHYARRLWYLADDKNLKYHYLGDFDSTLINLISDSGLLECTDINPLALNGSDQVMAFERKDYVFVFNFNPVKSFFGYRIPVKPGRYRIVLNTDDINYGGFGNIDENIVYLSLPEGGTGSGHDIMLYLPPRTGIVLKRSIPKRIY